MTFTITYNENKNKDIVLSSLSRREDSAYTSMSVFQKCCGSLAYLSLFILPEFELADKSTFSIERLCQSVPTIFKYDMRALLNNFGAIGCGNTILQPLTSILELSVLYDCLKLLGVSPLVWIRVMLYHYCELCGKPVTKELLYNYTTFTQLIQLFIETRDNTVL